MYISIPIHIYIMKYHIKNLYQPHFRSFRTVCIFELPKVAFLDDWIEDPQEPAKAPGLPAQPAVEGSMAIFFFGKWWVILTIKTGDLTMEAGDLTIKTGDEKFIKDRQTPWETMENHGKPMENCASFYPAKLTGETPSTTTHFHGDNSALRPGGFSWLRDGKWMRMGHISIFKPISISIIDMPHWDMPKF